MNKPFDAALYEENDSAKLIVRDFFNYLGFNCEVNEDKYGVDLILTDQDKLMKKLFLGVEVEVKKSWRGKQFPYKTLHISMRKHKFVQKKTLFAMVNIDRTHMMLISLKELIKAKSVMKPNKYMQQEWFYEIDTKKCQLVSLEHYFAGAN
jgi:hypothetical protein